MCRFGLIFRNQVEFRSEIATGGSGTRGYGDGVTTGGIHRVVHSRQPEIGYHLRQRSLFSGLFVNPRADVLDVPPAELIGEGQLVVSESVNLVMSAPGVPFGFLLPEA
jgi:hypothetical protein